MTRETRLYWWSFLLSSIGDLRQELYIAQAIRHGHPNWSHLYAYGPCVKED